MKKIIILSFIFSWSLFFCVSAQTTGATKKKLFEIGPGESPVYSECNILLGSSSTDVSLVTLSGSSTYYMYNNGKKTGPFDDVKKIEWKVDDDAQNDLYSSIFTDDKEPDPMKYLTPNDNGYMMVNANGKKYGPFQMVVNVFADNDGVFRSAITMKDMDASQLTESGTLVKLPGIPDYTCVSPSGKIVIIVATSQYNPGAEMANVDFSKMSQEELMKFSREIEAKQKAAPAPQTFLFFNDGKKLGPYPKEAFSGNNPAFCKTGGENWFMKIGSKLYVNGKELAELKDEYISNDDIWLSEDGKRFAITTYDKLIFSDGTSFDYPLMIKRNVKDGKTTFNWVAIENGRDVILFSKNL